MADESDVSKLPDYMATLSFERRKSQDEWLQRNEKAREAFEKATRALSSLKSGDTDPWLGLKIDTIIRKSTRYIIYLDTELDVQWWWLTRPDEKAVGLVQARIGQLTKESSFLLIGRRIRWWRTSERGEINATDRYSAKEIRCVMGEALALALNGASEKECEAVLDEAKRYIAVAKDQRTRPIFLGFFLLVVAVLGGILGAWLCLMARCCTASIDYRLVGRWLEAAVAGSAGALISSMLRTRELGLEPAAGVKGLIIEATARALIGAGSGVLVSFAYDSGLILKGAIQAQADAERWLRLFLFVASGVSERMLPALVGRAESLTGGTSEQTNARAGDDTPKPTDGSPARPAPANAQPARVVEQPAPEGEPREGAAPGG